MPEKIKFPLHTAEPVSRQICDLLSPACVQLQVAGSIRRRKSLVGDIEILAIPQITTGSSPHELFPIRKNLLNELVLLLIESKELSFRVKKDGTIANGEKVKLLRHNKSGIPLDIFITDQECWFNALVCRTGGKNTNSYIASSAKKIGYNWKMGGSGFKNMQTGQVTKVLTEKDVFDFVKIPYLPPEDRP